MFENQRLRLLDMRARAAEDQLAAVRGAARAVLEYRDADDVAFRAAVSVLLVKALGADALRGDK